MFLINILQNALINATMTHRLTYLRVPFEIKKKKGIF